VLGVVRGRRCTCPAVLRYAAARLLFDILSCHAVAEKVLQLHLGRLELDGLPREFPSDVARSKERSRSRSKGREKRAKRE
jgi:hypothetical protein